MPPAGNYTPDHVRSLIEDYPAYQALADTDARGLRVLVQVADIGRVLERLPDSYWEVVLLHGLLGLPQREVAGHLGVSQMTVSRRYTNALEEITHQINGGTP